MPMPADVIHNSPRNDLSLGMAPFCTEISCARGDTICPRPLYASRCGPAAAHPYACGAKRALLPIAVGFMNRPINELMNINDVRESATTFPSLQDDLWPFDFEKLARVTCDVGYLCANFGLPRPLFSSYSRCTRQTDRCQTSDRRQTKASLNAPV